MKKKANHFGRWAITVALTACVLFLVAFGNLALRYIQSVPSPSDIQFVIVSTWATTVLAFCGLILSIICLCRKGEAKKTSISACILSALLLLLSGTFVFFYHYMFSTLKQDETFQQAQLHVVTPKEDGVIDLCPVPPEVTLPPKEVEEKMQTLNLEYLVDEDVPDWVLAYMDRYSPTKECILLPGAKNVRNYLLFGLDEIGSSDSILLISMDSLHKKIKMISIPRDSYAYLPQIGAYSRITYAYSYGGAAMAVSTVNHNLSMNVTDYLTLSLDEVQMVIDHVGGVTVNMGYAEWNYFTQCGFEGLNVGECHLNGWEAMNYMRLRETDNEVRRMERQREVLQSLYTSALQLPVEKFPELIRGGMQMCTTSLDTYTLLSLALEAVQGHYTLEQYGLVDLVEYRGDCFGPQGYFYVVYDWDYAADTLYRLIYEDYYISGYDYDAE